jgi:hypothetical protein
MWHIGDRWADEFRHQTARGYMLFNWTGRYRYKNLEAVLSIENLTNTDGREAQSSSPPGFPASPPAASTTFTTRPGPPVLSRRNRLPLLMPRSSDDHHPALLRS